MNIFSTEVSVIIPVYNTEQYLRQCLDSVVNQTFKDIEIICVNDCSTDNSLQILKEYQHKDNRIIIIDLTENKGAGNARNNGVNVAKGQYLTFIDSDDWIKENYIEVLYNAIKKYKTNVAVARIIKYDNIKKTFIKYSKIHNFYNKSLKTSSDKKNILLSIPVAMVAALIVEKDFVINNNIVFIKTKQIEDLIYFFTLLSHNSSFVYIKDQLFFYRINRAESIMTNFNLSTKSNFMGIFNFFQDIIDIFKKAHSFDIYKKEIYVYLFWFFCKKIVEQKLTNKEYFEAVKCYKSNFYQDNLYFLKVKNIKNKIRLFIFYLCLKMNINYIKIGKCLEFLNNIIS